MKLITKTIAKQIPPLYSQDGKSPSAVKVPLKIFNPSGIGTWYITEMDPTTGMAFGWCDLGEPELGYVNLNELATFHGQFGLPMERDTWWDGNTTLQEVMDGQVR